MELAQQTCPNLHQQIHNKVAELLTQFSPEEVVAIVNEDQSYLLAEHRPEILVDVIEFVSVHEPNEDVRNSLINALDSCYIAGFVSCLQNSFNIKGH